MKIVFDHGTPVPLRHALTGHAVSTAFELGWATLKNGELLSRAVKEFDILITTDQNLRYQQDLSHLRLAVLVLPTNQLAEDPTARRSGDRGRRRGPRRRMPRDRLSGECVTEAGDPSTSIDLLIRALSARRCGLTERQQRARRGFSTPRVPTYPRGPRTRTPDSAAA